MTITLARSTHILETTSKGSVFGHCLSNIVLNIHDFIIFEHFKERFMAADNVLT